jgi:hypothetical protein
MRYFAKSSLVDTDLKMAKVSDANAMEDLLPSGLLGQRVKVAGEPRDGFERSPHVSAGRARCREVAGRSSEMQGSSRSARHLPHQ